MQRLKRVIKKMATIGTAVAMLGATMSGAAALDLADYPAPFVTAGAYDSSNAFVVGSKAAASDTLGLAEIATSLQFESKTCVAGNAPGSISISGDSLRISEGSDLLEVREDIGNVRETVTELDLDGLRGGVMTTDEGTTEYNQYLRFQSTGANLTLTAPVVNFTENDATVEDVADFLVIKEGTNTSTAFFEYELEFEEGLESDIVSNKLDDLEDEEMVILGQVYNVVNTKIDTVNNEITLEMLGGNVFDTLEEGEEKTYTVDGKDYKIEVLIIEDTSPETVTFRINGKLTDQLDEGETEVLDDGTLIGVSDLINNDAGEAGSGDIVEFYLGANKLELRDNEYTDDLFEQRVEIDNENIEDAFVQIKINEIDSSSAEITTIRYRLNADALAGSSDIFVPAGHGVKEFLDEPQGMLGDWDIRYEGLTDTGVSLVKLDPSGDDEYKLTVESRQGHVYTFPFVTIEGGVFKYGDDDDDFVFVEGNVSLSGSNIVFFAPNIGDDDFFVLSDMDGALDDTSFSHIIRYESIDTANRQLLFDDLATGSRRFTYEDDSTNSSVLGSADLVFGGNTYKTYVENGTSTAGVLSGTAGANELGIDMNSDGDIRRDEVRFTLNGGGVLDFGEVSGGNTTLIFGGGSGAGEDNLNITNVTADHAEPYNQSNSSYLFVVGNSRVIGTNRSNANFSITTLSENFDENTPPSLKGRGITNTFNEVIKVQITTRAGNELGIPSGSSSLLLGSLNNLTEKGAANDTFLGAGSFTQEPDTNEDHLIGLTDYGVYVDLFDPSTGGQDAETITFEYPLAQRGVEVFIVMGESSVTKSKGGQICTVANISPRTLLDSEVGSRTSDYNLILVGGPCANDVVEKVSGFPACSAWPYSPGEAVIQLASNGDNVALLIAGTDALDTRMASKVIANFEDHDLSGAKAMVTGTLSSPKVSVE